MRTNFNGLLWILRMHVYGVIVRDIAITVITCARHLKADITGLEILRKTRPLLLDKAVESEGGTEDAIVRQNKVCRSYLTESECL